MESVLLPNLCGSEDLRFFFQHRKDLKGTNTFLKTRFHDTVLKDSEHEVKSLLHRLYNQLVTKYVN